MKKFFAIAAIMFAFAFGFGTEAFAQQPRQRQRQTQARPAAKQPAAAPAERQAAGRPTARPSNNDYRLSDGARQLIKLNCPDMLRAANAGNDGGIMSLCPVRNVAAAPTTDLGPWREIVLAGVRLFEQIKNLIYAAAVFLLLWILVEGAYRGEARWMKLWWLVIGLVGMAGANVFMSMALGDATVGDVVRGNLYVDCRRPNEPLYPCAGNRHDALQLDGRFVFMYQGNPQTPRAGLY